MVGRYEIRKSKPRAAPKRRINWRKGSSTALYYIACMWLMTLTIILFIEYYNSLGKVGTAQMASDILVDGTTYIGNNGASIDKKTAKSVYKDLKKLNGAKKEGGLMSDVKLPSEPTFVYVKKKPSAGSNPGPSGYTTKKVSSSGKTIANGTALKVQTKAKTITTGSSIKSDAMSKTKYTTLSWTSGSEGMRIVMEAWKHTYEYVQKHGGRQTKYQWGGGHGIPDDPTSSGGSAWETASDCSGFVSGVFRKCGYTNISSSNYTGSLEECGTLIGEGSSLSACLKNAQPGDIILYWRHGYAKYMSQHVTIYAGDKNGKHYCVECHGNSADIMPVGNSSKGAHINACEEGSGYHYMVRRLIQSDATTKATKEVRISGLNATETRVAQALAEQGYTTAGIAGLMGNWKAESGVSNYSVQGHYDPIECYGLSTNIVDKMDKLTFSAPAKRGLTSLWNTGEGFGLAQWTWYTRKEALWDWAHNMGTTVSNLDAQISFAVFEIRTAFPAVYNRLMTVTDPQQAATYVYMNYEIPDLTTDTSGPARRSNATYYYSRIN